MNFCPQCGAKATSDNRFCPACGASQGEPMASNVRPDSLLSAAKSPTSSNSSMSVTRIALGVVVGIGIIWVFLPGIFDSRSPSIFGSEHRRSPLVEMAGPKTIVDDVTNIKEDQYHNYSFELKVPAEVSLTVTREKGPRFEVYVMEKSDHEEFSTAANSVFGGEFHHFKEFAGIVSTKEPLLHRKGGLKAGTYVAIIDNTDFGKVSPPANFADDVVTARVKIVIE